MHLQITWLKVKNVSRKIKEDRHLRLKCCPGTKRQTSQVNYKTKELPCKGEIITLIKVMYKCVEINYYSRAPNESILL